MRNFLIKCSIFLLAGIGISFSMEERTKDPLQQSKITIKLISSSNTAIDPSKKMKELTFKFNVGIFEKDPYGEFKMTVGDEKIKDLTLGEVHKSLLHHIRSEQNKRKDKRPLYIKGICIETIKSPWNFNAMDNYYYDVSTFFSTTLHQKLQRSSLLQNLPNYVINVQEITSEQFLHLNSKRPQTMSGVDSWLVLLTYLPDTSSIRKDVDEAQKRQLKRPSYSHNAPGNSFEMAMQQIQMNYTQIKDQLDQSKKKEATWKTIAELENYEKVVLSEKLKRACIENQNIKRTNHNLIEETTQQKKKMETSKKEKETLEKDRDALKRKVFELEEKEQKRMPPKKRLKSGDPT